MVSRLSEPGKQSTPAQRTFFLSRTNLLFLFFQSSMIPVLLLYRCILYPFPSAVQCSRYRSGFHLIWSIYLLLPTREG